MANVALLNDSFRPQLDGVAVCVENYAQILNRDYGRSFVIVPEEKKRNVNDFPYEVIEYLALNTIVADQYKVGLPITPKFRKEIAAISIDLVHSHTPFVSGLLGQRIANRKGVPHISTFHSKYRDDLRQRMTINSEIPEEIVTNYIVNFYNHCDYVWTVSNGTAETLHEYGYKGEVLVMPNGCDMEVTYRDETVRRNIGEEYGVRTDVPIFLFVGRLTKLKNIHLIAQALGALKRNGHQFSMLYVGGGEDEKFLRSLIKEHQLEEETKFAGKVMDRDKLREIYSSCDLFVFPSVYDNAPLVVREAAACGCPSLLVRGSNSAEGVTHGKNGILVQERIEDIAFGLHDALNKYDLDEMGNRAREDIYISWDDVLAKVAEEYKRILTDWTPKDNSWLKKPISDIDLFNEIHSALPKLIQSLNW